MTRAVQDKSQLTLGSKSIPKLLFEYSVPAIIASIAVSLYNIIDSIYIGQGVGPMAIAGLAITFPLMNLVIAFNTLISVGGATISSILLGQKNHKRATEVVNNVMAVCLIHSVVFGGLTLYFLDPILYFFGATGETISYAREFMRVILLGTPISFVMLGLNNLMRATGYPKKAMVTALMSVVINVIFAPIFIFVFKWGIAGAALATVSAQFVSMFWVLKHFLSKSSIVHLDTKNRWITGSLLKKIYSIGLSPFLMNVCACVVVIIINKSLLEYGGASGNLAVGSFGIINRTSMLFMMVTFGVTQGMQPILGYNYGAGEWRRVMRTLRIGLVIGIIITTTGWLITRLFPGAVCLLFTKDHDLIALAKDGIRIFFICYPIVGGQIVIQNFFQSIGKPKLSIFLSLTRQLIFVIPFLYILPVYYGVNGVWASITAADGLAFLIAVVTLLIVLRNQNQHFDRLRGHGK